MVMPLELRELQVVTHLELLGCQVMILLELSEGLEVFSLKTCFEISE